MFGTFEAERSDVKLVYGLVDQPQFWNPVWHQVSSYISISSRYTDLSSNTSFGTRLIPFWQINNPHWGSKFVMSVFWKHVIGAEFKEKKRKTKIVKRKPPPPQPPLPTHERRDRAGDFFSPFPAPAQYQHQQLHSAQYQHQHQHSISISNSTCTLSISASAPSQYHYQHQHMHTTNISISTCTVEQI